MNQTTTIERNPEDGDEILHVRSYRGLRQIAKDWQHFSNDVLGRIQIPAEDKTRQFRQYPIETDPPAHTAYRNLVQATFDKPNTPAYAAQIEALVERMVADALAEGEIDAVAGFALPLQSRALTHLLGMPIDEADLWISWGVHAFRAETGYDLVKAQRLVDYIADRLEKAPEHWPNSLFAALRQMRLDGELLPQETQMGFAHLVFAGGRDTVIRLISGGIAYLAAHPEAFSRLKADPTLAVSLTEELVRYLSPLPFLGRVSTGATEIDGHSVAGGQRVALCFAEANRDPAVFPDADKVVMDRRPNPHVGFGSGPHSCLGSGHARLLSHSVLKVLARRVGKITPIDDLANWAESETVRVRFS